MQSHLSIFPTNISSVSRNFPACLPCVVAQGPLHDATKDGAEEGYFTAGSKTIDSYLLLHNDILVFVQELTESTLSYLCSNKHMLLIIHKSWCSSCKGILMVPFCFYPRKQLKNHSYYYSIKATCFFGLFIFFLVTLRVLFDVDQFTGFMQYLSL